MSRAVVLLSGGLDSCVSAALAAETHDELYFLHADYGQRTEARERQAFEELAEAFSAKGQLVVSLKHLEDIGGSSLTDTSMEVTEADLESEEIPSSYVPFRNANLLAVATSWAEVLEADAIVVGAVSEDSSGYPDCRPEFFRDFEQVINSGSKPDTHIRIETPIIALSKKEIVETGLRLKAPIEKTWSCYRSEDQACGSCDSCALRLRGFYQAGAFDPIPYKVRPEYR